ncbi:MAG: prepilin-type N-terminal cleavage/methylation domain-containing protein [Vampirovibrionales bacterium]|nr:prepilin-type N-terminal cleavage/methylation domain-containing protein [Vampirovibrionales bacterium]
MASGFLKNKFRPRKRLARKLAAQKMLTGQPNPGFTLAEIIVALILMGLVAVFSVNLIMTRPSDRFARMTEDYIHHLASIYEAQNLRTGSPPITATTPDGMAALLPQLESMATHTTSSPEQITYTNRMVVYLKPEQVSGISNPVLTGTDNREWLLLDVDGTQGSNSLTSSGDRVLIHVDNDTGQVQTAWQVDSGSFSQSFYDVYKGY